MAPGKVQTPGGLPEGGISHNLPCAVKANPSDQYLPRLGGFSRLFARIDFFVMPCPESADGEEGYLEREGQIMRRCLWGLPASLLGGVVALAQNPPLSQPPQTVAPFALPSQPVQLPSMSNLVTPVTPIPPPPMIGATGMPAMPTGQPPVAQGPQRLPSTTPAQPTVLAQSPENLVSFDNLRVDLSWANNHWQLKSGDVVLKDFGRRELEAHQALRLIRELHLTQRGTIGSPNPVMEYWLCGGRAPQGLTPGLRTVALDPSSLRVEQDQGQWVLRDPRRVLFNFGRSEAEARQAQALIQKYGFSQLALIGQAAPTMMVFLSQPTDRLATQTLPNGASLSPPASQPHGPTAPTPDVMAKLTGGVNTLVTPTVPPLRETAHQAQGPRSPLGGIPAHDLQLAHHTLLSPEKTIPGLGELSNKVPFDWRQVKLIQEGASWKLKVYGHQLADFGPDHVSAQRAFDTVRYYRFSEQCFVGGPQPCFSYYLVNGGAPQGSPSWYGTQAQAFQPEKLQVKQIGPRWAIVTSDQPLIQLNDKPEEAKQLLEVIQRNRFDRLCRIGPDDEHSLTYFVRSR